MFCWTLLFVGLVVCTTQGRLAAPNLLNIVSNHEELPSAGKPVEVKFINITSLKDVDTLSKVFADIGLKPLWRRNSNQTKDIQDNEVHPDDNEPGEPVGKVDNGTALILTPYIEEGRLIEGREASAVNPDVFLGVKSYSGFMTVNKTYNSNIFFWYFPVENKPVNETPWIIWLQGGPGASSMTGLFEEIGPFRIKKDGIIRNPYTWLQNHSLVFIDNPVGTGYSFTNDAKGFVRDMATYSKHLYSTLRQFLQLFPELRTAPLFLAGESYAGKYVPAFGMEIHKHKDEPGADVNLKGFMIGNAYVEPTMVASVPTVFYQLGLMTREQLEIVKPLNEAFRREINANNSVAAKTEWTQLIYILLSLSHLGQAYNFLEDELTAAQYEAFLKRSEVKRALHVGDIANSFVNISVNVILAPDFLSNTRPMFETLLDNNYDVMAYCGQLDLMLACPVAFEHYRRWKWNQSELFLNATRNAFGQRDKLAGYVKSGGHMTEVLVRRAGHMAPRDAPATLQRLVSQWTARRRLDDVLPGPKESAVRDYVRNITTAYL